MQNTDKVKNRKMMSLAILFVSALEMGAWASCRPWRPFRPLRRAHHHHPDGSQLARSDDASGLCHFDLACHAGLKKVLCQIGVACSAAIGILGYLFNSSITMLYMWATLLGIGFGFLMPTSNGIIAEQYDESERGKLMGIQDLFTNGGGIYLTYVGGALAAINWHMNYLAYLIGIIPFVLGCIYLPNDKPSHEQKAKEHFKVSPKTWMYGIFIFMFINAYNVFGCNVSFVVVERGLGSPATSGTAMSLFLVGGMIGGLLFNPFVKKFKDFTFCFAFLFLTAGYLIMYYSSALAMVYIGAVVTGISIGLAMPSALLGCTNCNTVVAATAGCAVAHVCGQLGTVCSAFFFTPVSALFSDAADFRYLFAAIVCAVIAVLVAVVVSIVNRHSKTVKA